MANYKFLKPYTFKKGITVKNRVVIPPMTEESSLQDGTVSRDELRFFDKRTGGVGMFITPNAYVTEGGKTYEGQLSITDDRYIPGLAKLAQTIKRSGTLAILQVHHGGRMSNSRVLRGKQPVSASAVAAPRKGFETPRALTNDEIESIIEAFGEATRRAIQAGFDGFEIHGANTYLIQQFFSPHSNRRTDKWGGSLENRMQFPLAIIKACQAAIDKYATKPFLLGYRLSPEEIEKPGIRMADTLKLIDALCDQPLDYISISMGNVWRTSLNDPDEKEPTILTIKKRIAGRLPLIAAGSVITPENAEKVMDAGIDFVAIGREYIIEPKWIDKVKDGLEKTIRYKLNRESLDEIGINPSLMDFLENVLGQHLPFEGEEKQQNSDDYAPVFNK